MKEIIYLAAPLFMQAERFWNIKLIEAILKKSNEFIIILPQEETLPAIDSDEVDLKRVFDICIEGIDKCDIILAILDGADSDSGTCFECGYGFAKNKRLIGIRTDTRKGKEDINAMLINSCEIILFDAKQDTEDGIEKLAELIISKIKSKNKHVIT